MATFELRRESYRLITREGRDLSEEARAALGAATRPMGMIDRRVQCSGPVAIEMLNWFKDHAREYLSTIRHHHNGRVCGEAAQVIGRALAPDADLSAWEESLGQTLCPDCGPRGVRARVWRTPTGKLRRYFKCCGTAIEQTEWG